MRSIKRLLLFASEVGVLAVGLVFSLAVAACIDSVEGGLTAPVFYSGLFLTVAGVLVFRRKTRPWKIKYEAESWELSRAERRLHPARVRYKRIAQRALLWVPSLLAAVVLFFLPVATHVVHPCSHYLRHYRVPIPWNFAVFSSPGPPAAYSYVLAFASSSGKGRFGMTRSWDSEQVPSVMLFGSIQPDADTFEFNHRSTMSRRAGAAQELQRGFRLGNIAFTCWQYVHHDRYGVRSGPSGAKPLWWNIDCETPVDVRQHNLYAWFEGREEDIPAFYKIIEGVRLIK
jgi:hypothetical protein